MSTSANNSITFYPGLDSWNRTTPYTPKEYEEYLQLMAQGKAPLVRFLSPVCVRDSEALQVWISEHDWMLSAKLTLMETKPETIENSFERREMIEKRKKLLLIISEAENKLRQLQCPPQQQ